MKIVIPSKDEKLCGHFGNCDYFSFVEVEPDTKEIINIEKRIPEGGVSCQAAGWIAEEGADIVLAGGMGMRPLMMFQEANVEVISGCPEIEIKEIVKSYLDNTLISGENSCAGGHEGGHCHSEGHCHH